MRSVGVALIIVAAGVAACAKSRPLPPAPCDTVTGTATSYGRTISQRYAERDLARQLTDARGDLVSSGIRRVRVVARRSSCRPYSVFGAGTGLVTCTAQARVCGR